MSGPRDAALHAQAQRLLDPLLPLIAARTSEGGTWVPRLAGTGATPGAFTYAVQEGYWFRQGPLIFIACRIRVSATTTTPTPTALRILGLPPFLPISNDANDVRVGQMSGVALTANRLGLTARVITENGEARIELREYGSNVAADPYSTTLLASSSSFDLSVAGRYLADAAPATLAPPVGGAGLNLGSPDDLGRAIVIGVL